jgi:DNA repair exonuclease SbcCD ATPase subunit
MAMREFLGMKLAAPGTALLKPSGAGELAFDSNYWRHLARYIGKVDSLPEAVEGCSAETAKALDGLRSLAPDFSSPRRLRQLLLERPEALADAQSPATFYAGIVWLAQHLHESAAFVVSVLQSIEEAAASANDVKEGLQLLGRKAQDARTSTGPLIGSLRDFKSAILKANSALAGASTTDAEHLHRLQEAVGGLKVKVEKLNKEIGEIGIFGARRKHELEGQLKSLQQELEEKSAQAEKLRAALGKIEPIREEASWLEPSLTDLVEFFEKARTVWTTFGSGLSQLIADAADDQLEDSAWLKRVLGLDEAITQWQAIDQAAKRFAAASLVDTD